MWTLHASQRHQQTGISISHLDRSSRRTSFEEKSQAHAYHRQSPPSFSVSSSLLTQALPAPRRLNLSKVLCVCEEEVCVQKEMVFEKENGNARWRVHRRREGRGGDGAAHGDTKNTITKGRFYSRGAPRTCRWLASSSLFSTKAAIWSQTISRRT